MNKKDILIVVMLFALWILWSPIDRHLIKPLFPAKPTPEAVTEEIEPAIPPRVPDEIPVEVPSAPVLEAATETPTPASTEPAAPEELHVLSNERMDITISSHGGAIVRAVLHEYRQTVDPESPEIELIFDSARALEIEGLELLTGKDAFRMDVSDDGHRVRLSRDTSYGLRFVRTIEMADTYLLRVSDRFDNTGSTARGLSYGLKIGSMQPLAGATSTYGLLPLGVDALGLKGVEYWGRKFDGWFKQSSAKTVRQTIDDPAEWLTVKNKYFLQTLFPRDGIERYTIFASREGQTRIPEETWAVAQFPDMQLAPGSSYVRDMNFYIGPKKYSELKKLGFYVEDVMELGWLKPISVVLLHGLNFFHDRVWPYNYGLAIMLLTVIIRVVFWPLTHKGTESMRRMQELGPLFKEVQEKFKDDPQKRQEAVMALYKEHKVNPIGGCLPMLIQIPVFIGLFYVLRSAIELRFASFLWINDLSEQEAIFDFGFTLPLLGWDAFNILPILMAATMFWQQKLTPMTPAGGDPRQQQMHQTMMRIMPLMMLFLLYKFASGLALYWTTQNALMILQQVLYRRRLEARKAAESAQKSGA